MKFGVIARYDLVDIATGKITPKPGYVSFTRDKSYTSAPGSRAGAEVRFIFERDAITNRYKTKPYVDRSVMKNIRDETPLNQHEARWESEEIVYGPVSVKYAERIEILKSVYENRMLYLDYWQNSLEKIEEYKEKLNDGLFWHQIKQQYQKIEDYPKLSKQKIKSRIENSETNLKQQIEAEKTLLSDPRIEIVNSF
jgi:hypothetical protein